MSFSDDVRAVFPECDLSTGPFGLLALPVAPVERQAVFHALRARLNTLDAMRDPSPSAALVREALHVAAAQLADRELQDALLAQHRAAKLVSEQPIGERPATPTATQPSQVISPEAQTLLRHTLASSGGWNRIAAKRVARFAALQGLQPAQLFGALSLAARSESGVKQRIYGVQNRPAADQSHQHPQKSSS